MKKIIFVLFYCLCIICNSNAQKIPSIDRSRFEVSTKNISFSGDGGSKTITVKADQPWSVKEYPASWASLTRYKERIEVKVNGNNFNESRNTSFSITSSGKTITIGIKQDEMPILEISPIQSGMTPRFSVSSTSANFTAAGGSQTFTINSNSSWSIETQPKSWGHLTKKDKTLTLNVDRNNLASSRNDYFTIRSGSKRIRVDITQAGALPKLDISSTSAYFDENGGTKKFTISSNQTWHIDVNTTSWGRLYKEGNTLTLKVEKNIQTESRRDFFVIKSEDKKIRVDITQAAGYPYLFVNGKTTDTDVNLKQYGGTEIISVNTNVENYEIFNKLSWCYINEKGPSGFVLGYIKNSSSYPRSGSMRVIADGKIVQVNLNQEPNYRKMLRRRNGGWLNMAIGFEAGYGSAWYANGIVGLRLGNYKDVLQFELGITPGIAGINYGDEYADDYAFHLPVYSSLKLSTKRGKFYLKLGGTYNVIYDKYYEGKYSLRAGFGSAWKHFEWDWASFQLNAPADYWYDSKFSDIFNEPDMMFGMRMAWYITR